MIARSFYARFLFALAFAVAACSLLAAQASNAELHTLPDMGPTLVPRQEVLRAVVSELRQRGLSEQELPRVEDLDLPATLPSLAGRRLRVRSSCSDEGLRRTQFRLECGAPGQCLPFLVYVRDSVRDRVHYGLSSGLGALAGSCRMASSRPPLEALVKPAVRAGDRATAVFLADRLRMTASVTCLERGREGEVIRVRGLDGHVFRARISGPDQLEALPQ